MLKSKDLEEMREEIIEKIKEEMKVDEVVMGIKGEMVEKGYEDWEGEIMESVREIVGKGVMVERELDKNRKMKKKRVKKINILE